MDPLARETIRGFLAQDEVIERVRGDEDVHEALLDLVPVPKLAPHVVHVKATFEDEDSSYYDDKVDAEGKPILHERTTKVRRQIVTQCPDCGLGLTSRPSADHEFEMFCPRLSPKPGTEGDACHAGCVIACGTER